MRRLAIALVLAGCNADIHHTPDGGPPDVLPDSLTTSTGEPPANAVKLHVTRAGMPVPNVAVFFQATDSAPIASSLTNDTGVAWAVMPAGGFVTAVEHVAGIDELTTFSAVQSGDVLELAFAPTGSTITASFTIELPTSLDAAVYKVYSPCGSQAIASATDDITLSGCPNPTDLVVVPLDGNGDPVGTALYASNVDIKAATVDLQAGTYEPLATNEYKLTSVPETVTYIGLYGAFSAQYRAFEANTGGEVTANVATLGMQMPSTATGTELTVATEFPTSGEVGRETIYNWHAPTTTYALDIASVQLSRYATAPAFAAHALTWSERGGGTEPDFVRAKVHAYRDGFPQGHAWHWQIVAPRTGTTVTFPTLPVVDFDFNLKDGDVAGVDELETISLPGGYAGVRAHAFGDVKRTISGTLGRIVVQSLYFEAL